MNPRVPEGFAGLVRIHQRLIREMDGDACGPVLYPPSRCTARDWRPRFTRTAYESADPAALELGSAESFHDIPAAKLDAAIRHIVDVEGPAHVRVVAERLLMAADVGRLGARIRERIAERLDTLAQAGEIVQQGDFVGRPEDCRAPPVRDRSELSDKLRDLAYVAAAERMQALFLAVLDNEGATVDDAMRAALELLGFARLTDNAREDLQPPLDALIARGMVREHNGCLLLGEGAFVR